MMQHQNEKFYEAFTDYIESVEPEWARFVKRRVPIALLEQAWRRPLRLSDVDLSMAGQSQTKGPLMLDDDYSVIDGMHRLATALVKKKKTIVAVVRSPRACPNKR